jgi:hypothetical protein
MWFELLIRFNVTNVNYNLEVCNKDGVFLNELDKIKMNFFNPIYPLYGQIYV